jgi:hypothetical protein
MTPGTVFVSHRHDYAGLVHELKRVVETTSRGKIKVFTSEDLSGAKDWRAAIQSQLQEAESLVLVYGAAYEDWSWCFYETGFFAGIDAAEKLSRQIYCIARPSVPAPGPLANLQMVTDKEQLEVTLIDIYEKNRVEYDPAKLRQSVDQVAKSLFGKLDEFMSYPRIYFEAGDAAFGPASDLPACAALKGDRVVLTQLFGIGREVIRWDEVVRADPGGRTPQEQMFYGKWVDETKKIILAARDNRFIAPQTVLIVRGGLRYRFLLYQARVQGDGRFCCEFLVVGDVGGPALGLSQQMLALLTTIRLGFRFRYELIRQFDVQSGELSDAERRARIEQVPRIIDNLLTESDARGNITLQDLQAAFDDDEADRIGKLAGYWPILKDYLYDSLGISAEGKPISERGLIGPNLEQYRIAFDSLRLLNIEFLSRCCARVSRMIVRSEEDLKKKAELLERNLAALGRSHAKAA